RGAPRHAADLLMLAFGIFVLVLLMGSLFAFSSVYGEASAIRVPPSTLLCFLSLATLMVLHRSGGGILAVLHGEGIGSRIVRVAIPLALALPLLLSLLRSYVVSTGLLAPAYASAASICFICLCVTLLILLMGRRINRLEREVRELLEKRSAERVQESERRYVELVEQSISGFVVRRPDGRLVLVNEAYRRMTGYTREELLQLSAKDLVVDQGVLERARRLEPGQSTHIETFLRRKDGSLLEVEYVTQRTRDGNLQSVLLDVSHRKQLQKQRDESERRYAELVEQAQEGISVRRPSGEFVFVNDTFCTMLGYARGELLELRIQDVVHPDDRETIVQVQQLGHAGHLRLHKRMLRKDGAVIHVEVSAKRLRGGDIQSTVQDVTERKLAQQRYRDLVEQAADAIWLRGADGRMLFVNDAGCGLLGYSREELLQSAASELIHPTDPRTAASIDSLRPLETLRIERIMRHKDGHPIPVEASAHRLADGSVQVISHDITVRKCIEEELRHMSQRLREAQETERRAIARELHDEVGQALTATRINLRDLQQQAGDGPLGSRLAASEEVVAELLGKVRQMSLDLHPSVLDDLGLGPALRWCVRTRAVGSELKVSLDLPDGLPRFDDMAEITLFRVFQETLSNVLKHSGAAHLQVRLEYSGDRLVMSAKDDGRGFDAEAARQRALSGKSLGLLGMQERARLAGGELILESSPGQGAEVRVSLPARVR
ncbi:MAG TPA: PAS domain-containing sensor histidine kinase, partial [Gammaproteobacteria bacterium]